MPFLFARLRETFIFEILISVIFAFLFYTGVLASTNIGSGIIMLFCIGLILIHLHKCLVEYYLFAGERELYYITNFTVLIIFASLNIVMAAFNAEPYYTWLFLPYKVFTQLGLGKVMSAALVHLTKICFVLWIPHKVLLRD